MLFYPGERGQGITEYALLIMLIALALIAVLALFGSQLSNVYSRIIAEWPD